MAEWQWVKTATPELKKRGGRTDDIWFCNDDTGWAVNSSGQILKTTDGARSWVVQKTLPSTYLRCITFASPLVGWVGTVTSNLRIVRTTDGGATWVPVENLPRQPSTICGICAVDENTVFAAGTNFPNRPTGFLRTTDGGNTWDFVDMAPHATILVDVFFKDAMQGWVVGGKGGEIRDAVRPVVLETTDGGSTWTNRLEAATSTFPAGEWGWKIHFVDKQVGFVSLENELDGAVLRTNDGGVTWRRLPVNDPQDNANLEGIGFLDANHGWVGGWGDKDFKGGCTSRTDDGGATWHDANEVGKFLNRFRILGNPVRVAYASGDYVYRYEPVADRAAVAPPDTREQASASMVRNAADEEYDDRLAIEVVVPPGTRSLRVEVWDRFAEHLATVADESDPAAGPRTIVWTPPADREGTPGLDHVIYRVAADERAESGVVRRVAAASADRTREVPPLPTPDEEREAFHRLTNIEDFPEFRPRARAMAEAYFAHADYDAHEHYSRFPYTREAFDERLDAIYDAYVPDMHRPHQHDQDIIVWRDGRRYRVGRASDDVVRDRLLHLAPFNLLDGAWLQSFAQARPADESEARLFSIWADEAGNGETRKNHANVYRDLLQGLGMYLPPVTSRDFLDLDIVDGAWRAPVFQIAVGLFPQTFYPELLGMTLYLEWEATPTMMPIVRSLQRRGINPLFYSLHMAIDNISEGHGALAKEAVTIYLDQVRDQGGERALATAWERVWNGYVTWATLGGLGAVMLERRLLIDGRTINIGTPDKPECLPDWKRHHRERMLALVRRKAGPGRKVHQRSNVNGQPLNALFDRPEDLLDALVAGGLVDPDHPRRSRLFELMEFEGPMYRVFDETDRALVLDWVESLRAAQPACIEPLPQTPPDGASADQVAEIIAAFAPRAMRAHDSLALPDADGILVPITELVDSPPRMMAALVRGGWVVPGQPDRSLFITEVLRDGPMAGVLDSDSVATFEQWVSDGAQQPTRSPDEREAAARAAARPPRFAALRPYLGQGAVH